MGKLTYDSSFEVDFDDRTLVHLQVVITAKLRRNESFLFTWKDMADVSDGRTAIWLHPTLSLVFKYHGGKPPEINRPWVESLMTSANSNAGLHIVDEPSEGSVTR